MVFDDDAMLFGLFARYVDEEDELKKQIVNYIKSEAPGSPDPFAPKTSEVDEVSSKNQLNGCSIIFSIISKLMVPKNCVFS